MREVDERIDESAEIIRNLVTEAEDIGQVRDLSVKAMRDAGVIRMLQTREFGGYVVHPVEFFQTILKVGPLCGSAGWIAGVAGIHSCQISQWEDRRVPQQRPPTRGSRRLRAVRSRPQGRGRLSVQRRPETGCTTSGGA